MARGDAKAKICETAIRLFNESGYDAVSLRQIAAEAGTTIGNLTYHFRRKEDLLTAILSDLHAGYTGLLDWSLAGEALLERLVELFAASRENQVRYPFYFGNLSQIMSAAPVLKGENDSFAADIYSYYSWALRSLGDEGVLQSPCSPGGLDAIAYSLVAMQSGWMQQSSPFNNVSIPRISLDRALCTILASCLDGAFLDKYGAICCRTGIEL